MSCCSPAAEFADAVVDRSGAANDELLLASRDIGSGLRQSDLSVPAIHCGGCIQTIEKALNALPGIEQARVNLSSRRVTIRWRADGTPPPLIETLPLRRAETSSTKLPLIEDGAMLELVRALAVSQASNISAVGLGLVRRQPATATCFTGFLP